MADGETEDWALLTAWRDGDQAAGKALVKRYMGSLRRFFHNKVRDPDYAADLISETLLACTKGKRTLEDPGAFRSFLFAIAMNQLRRHYRKAVKRQRELDDFADVFAGKEAPSTAASILAQKQEVRLLVQALRQISLDQQIVLELNFFERLNGAEIAELLGVPQKTVYTRIRRGRERLRDVMLEMTQSNQLVDATMMGLQTWAELVREQLDEQLPT